MPQTMGRGHETVSPLGRSGYGRNLYAVDLGCTENAGWNASGIEIQRSRFCVGPPEADRVDPAEGESLRWDRYIYGH